MQADRRWTAPSHAPTETLRTIRRYEQSGVVDPGSAAAMAAKVADARVRYVGPSSALLSGQWQLRNNISAYDAAYVVLAQNFKAPLLTTDGRLARAARAVGVAVRHVQRD